MRGRWSLAIAGRGPDPGGRPARPFHPDRRRHPDRGRQVQGRQGQHHERPALYPCRMPPRRSPPPASSRSTATSIRAKPRTALPSNSPAAAMWCWRSTRPAMATATRPPSPTGSAAPMGWPICAASTFVDKNNIGLEGHSMGGWTVLAAATADAQRLQVDGAGGLFDRQAVRRRRHPELAAQRRPGVRPV